MPSGSKANGKSTVADYEICILAGGLSTRMGQDKARLRLGRKSLLGHVRSNLVTLPWATRVIKRDLVQRCGPLGGIYTALKTTRAAKVVFVACDMPFVSGDLVAKVIRHSATTEALFTQSEGAGFPFVIARNALAQVETQIQSGQWSLQVLAKKLRAKIYRPNRSEKKWLFNVNTPVDWEKARAMIRTN